MLIRACQRCWHRKQKCDRQSPECSTCVAAGLQCVPRAYGDVQASAAAANSQSQTRSSIEYLKQRIKYLESEQQQREQDNDAASNSQTSPTHTGRTTKPRTSSTNLGLETPGHVVDVAVNEVEYLSLTAMSGGDKNDPNAASSLTFKQVMECIIFTDGNNPGLVTVDDTPSSERTNLILSDLELEIKSMLGKDPLHFIQILNTGLPWYLPAISEATCIAAFDVARRVEVEMPSEAAVSSTSHSIAVASLGLALGMTVSPHNQALHSQILKLVDLSKRALPQVLNTATDMMAIQCLIFQTVLSLYYPSAGSTWHLLGLALSKAVSAGLHRSISDGASSEEGNETAMIFWMLYILDRTVSNLMGRPLGLSENDFAMKMPELPTTQSLNDIKAISKAIFTWRIHYTCMLSQWVQFPNFDLDASFASYEYWKESYHEVCERLRQIESTQNRADETFVALQAVIQKDEATLSCRALVHLLDVGTKHLPSNDPSLLDLERYIVREASHFIDVTHKSIEGRTFALTFLDGYDALAAAVMYIFCVYDPNQPTSFRLGISQMKTVTASMDIIQTVAQQFKPLRGFKDVIWTLLQILEARAETRDVSGLLRDINSYEASIPTPLRRLIQLCTQT